MSLLICGSQIANLMEEPNSTVVTGDRKTAGERSYWGFLQHSRVSRGSGKAHMLTWWQFVHRRVWKGLLPLSDHYTLRICVELFYYTPQSQISIVSLLQKVRTLSRLQLKLSTVQRKEGQPISAQFFSQKITINPVKPKWALMGRRLF